MTRTAALLLLGTSCAVGLILCPKDYCSQVQCSSELTAESCAASGGRLAEKGGFCGCCASCISQIGEGQSCASMFLLGAPRAAECAQGLYCDADTRVCTKQTCSMTLEELSAQPPLLGRTMPVCDADGTYAPKQCSGSRCSCVQKDGTRIDSTSVPIWESSDMYCTCARDKSEYKKLGLIGKVFRCESNGNYASVQCTGSVCYCAHPQTGKQIEGTQGVSIGQASALNC